MPRAIWRGHLRLSLVSCEVSLYPATTEAEHIHFHMLSPKTENRVRQQLVDAETGDVVERKQVLHGYEYAKGRYVVVDDKELDRLKIESSHVIDIETFIDADDLDPLYLEKPYFMVPEGKLGAEAFAVIRAAMARQGKVGLGSVVLAQREHPVAVRPQGDGLSLTTLRSADEVRSDKALFGTIKSAKVQDDMVKLAESIIVGKAGDFDASAFHDRYQEALHALVESKRKGRKYKAPKVSKPSNVINLMDALRRSVGASQKSSRTHPVRPRKAASRRRKAS